MTQDFNTLANTGTSSTLPTGWYFTETGTNANTTYAADTGSSNSGNTYSYGASGSTERAFGTLASGSLVSRIGAKITNNTTGVLTSITLSYTGEQWRRGTSTGDGLAFSYTTSSAQADLRDGANWTAFDSLSFTSPACGTQNTATDGNSSACRTAISGTVTGLAIPPGSSIWIRWSDKDNVGSDDGVAIDDVSITAAGTFSSVSPSVTSAISTPASTTPGTNVTLSGNITSGYNPASASFTVTCDLTQIGISNTAAPLTVSGAAFSSQFSVALSSAIGALSLPCRISDDQSRSTNFSIALTVTVPLSTTCGAQATPIHAIQGAGSTSPIAGSTVDVEAIVTGDFHLASQLSGYYLEAPAAEQDANPLTSEGIFVFDAGRAVNVGDRVRLRGTVTEFASSGGSSLTELGTISSYQVCSSGNTLPPAVDISLPLASPTDWERYEGMRVSLNQPLVVAGTYNLGTFGEIVLAPSVQFTPTNVTGNATSWGAAASLFARSLIVLDDGSGLSNANLGIATYPSPGLSATNTLRIGALVNPGSPAAPLVGVVDERFGSYRIEPTSAVTFSNSPNPRPDASAIVSAAGGRYKIASANLLNFFTTLGGRGAATADELTNQRAKMIAALKKMNADLYGLSEVQNCANGNTGCSTPVTYTNAAVTDIVTNLNAATGRAYAFIDTLNTANIVGGNIADNGSDAIRSVILYDTAKLTPVGLAALNPFNSLSPNGNRPSIAQTFQPATGAKASTQTFTFVVNHLRSKGSSCGTGNDDTYQGNCNGTRLATARAVISWLSTNPTADPAGANRRILMVGDFNAYLGEDPIQEFINNGYTDTIAKFVGAGAYSYNFSNQVGYLDHGFANAPALALITKVSELHTNADEPAALEALDSSVKSTAAYAAYVAGNEFAASDHDPFITGFNPLRGDFDDDAVLSKADGALIQAQIGKNVGDPGVDRRMDLDGDGKITLTDYRAWVALYQAFIAR